MMKLCVVQSKTETPIFSYIRIVLLLAEIGLYIEEEDESSEWEDKSRSC